MLIFGEAHLRQILSVYPPLLPSRVIDRRSSGARRDFGDQRHTRR
jgi:hypothetical protein